MSGLIHITEYLYLPENNRVYPMPGFKKSLEKINAGNAQKYYRGAYAL